MKLSPMIAGMMRLADWDMSVSSRVSFIEQCVDAGVTSFDHADIYGQYQCEKLFGEALVKQPSLREKIQLISKCGIRFVSENRPKHSIKSYDTSYKHIVSSAENSLKELNTDYLDSLLIHRPDPLMNANEIALAFADLMQAGKILSAGVSNFLHHQTALIQSACDFPLAINQIEISVLHTESFYDGTLDYCQQFGMTPIAWSPLARGLLFNGESEQAARVSSKLKQVASALGATVDQVAFAWLLKHPAGIKPIIGSGNIERIKSAQGATQLRLADEQWFDILQASKGHKVP